MKEGLHETHALFSSKDKSKKIRLLSAAILPGSVSVKQTLDFEMYGYNQPFF